VNVQPDSPEPLGAPTQTNSVSLVRPATLFRGIALVLVLAAAATFVPLWAPLVLAAWLASMCRPMFLKLASYTHGRHRAAGALVVALVVLALVPLVLVAVSLAGGAADLVSRVGSSQGAKNALLAVVSGDETNGSGALSLWKSPERLVALAREHGAQALRIAGSVAGAATAAALGAFVFLYAFYTFLVDGPSLYAWAERHVPLEASRARRMTAAFHETGRGLFVGIGLTGLTQGVAATIAYVALGVPRALVLGLLTCVASLLPSIGTALVWVPIAAGLALSGRTGAALALTAIGLLVIGTVDNVFRPFFARFGKLELSSFVLLTAMFGGLAAFGGWGLLLGPLFVRLAKEALTIAREAKDERERTSEAAPRESGETTRASSSDVEASA
jgi:predicted PurR-regulated permease PerM